ncbi:hypothetical protein IAU60_002443 [Kwoniella sp. DSM 27419]
MLPPRLPTLSHRQSTPGQSHIHPDDAIRQTDDDAASSRLSATNLGYLDDPFTSLLYKPQFSPGSAQGGPSGSRKPPLINVGTHHRSVGIDTLIEKFLASDLALGVQSSEGERSARQVVSLGAGSDTRFWRLMSRDRPPDIAKYVEIDFPHLTSPKAQRIARSRKLHPALGSVPRSTPSGQDAQPAVPHPQPYQVSQGGTRLDSPIYTLLPLDLRPPSLQPETPPDSSPQSIAQILDTHLLPLLDPQLPTLFLAECLFPYMPAEDSRAIVGWFGSRFGRAVGVVYEMCGLDDGFGQVMRRNLATRNLSIPGSAPFPTPQSQADRFLDSSLANGQFTKAGAKTLWQVRKQVIPSEELRRISKLEFLDEIEELKLVLEHYVIAWGTKGVGMESISL